MSCNNCNNHCDPCDNSCKPAGYKCDFGISVNPFDESIWNVTICGATARLKIPKLNETDTKLSTDYNGRALVYDAERHQDRITGEELGGLIELNDLRDVNAPNPDSCSFLVFNPYCSDCGDGCAPKNPQWVPYHIPDAGDCIMEPDEDGFYHALVKDGCGCIKECRFPIVPNDAVTVNYIRDSVPDDPDYPWYYGQYNDKINLHLKENAGAYFGKFDLEVIVYYGIQVVHSIKALNTNFRSLVVPVVEGTSPNVAKQASILQAQSTISVNGEPHIPWGTVCLRGAFSFIVPKGKEAYLHHEFRLRTLASGGDYATNDLDGKKVPDEIAGQINKMDYTGSRLNALQVIIKPTSGKTVLEPTVDAEREQLDAAVDEYPNIGA